MNLVFQLFINGLASGSLYGLIGLGFVLQYRVTRFFNFAYSIVFAVGAYGCWTAVVAFRQSTSCLTCLFVCALLGIGLATIIGWLLEVFVYRRLRKRGATPLILLLASLGVLTVMQNVLSLLFGDDTKVIRPLTTPPALSISFPGMGIAHIAPIQIGTIGVTLLLGCTCALFLRYSIWGMRLRAVTSDPELAVIVGVDVDAAYTSVHALSSCLAGIASIWMALDADITPTMGFRILLMVTAAMVIGRLGSLPGIMLGGVTIGLIQSLSTLYVDTKWQDASVFIVLILFLLLKRRDIEN